MMFFPQPLLPPSPSSSPPPLLRPPSAKLTTSPVRREAKRRMEMEMKAKREQRE